MEKEYRYDAFISYRHCELDKYVAENLHKILETYELPKNIKEKLGINGRTIKRVFRDQDELPLSSNLEDPIIDALNNSKYLIVICSPRLKESLWCKKEIQTFKKLRGRKNIFCVLVEGEPSDSFPEEVLFDEIEVIDKNGKKKKEKGLVEPLAADVRGQNKKDVLKKLKEEKLRLIAPMYNLNYDDLKQRHRQRRIKRIIYTSVIAASICFLFAVYSTLMLLKISSQQKTLKRHQAISLSEQSSKYLEKDSRYNAVKSAYDALTKFKGVNMPYTPDAEYALMESLGIYNAGVSYKAMSELKTKGVIDYIKVSNDNDYALTIDESEEITLWDIKNMKKIKSFHDLNMFATTDEQFTFVGKDKFAYISKKGNVKVINIKDGSLVKEIKKNTYSYKSISSDEEGNFIVINDSPKLYLYSASNYKQIGKFECGEKEELASEMRFANSGKNLFVFVSKKTLNINDEIRTSVHNLSTKDLSNVDVFTINAKYIENIVENGSDLYLLANQSVGDKFNMLLVSYDNKNNKVNYEKSYSDSWGKFIIRSYAEDANNIALVHGNLIEVVNASNGELIRTYSVSSDVIGIYASTSSDMYLAFASDGTVNFLSLKYKENIIYSGLFELNLEKYNFVIKNNSGYLLVPKFDNRVIYYEQNKSKDLKELDIKLDYVSDQGIKLSDYDKVKKDYNLKKKNLVKKIIYADNKKILVVSYSDNTASIYNVKDKKFLKIIENVDVLEHYFGKDKYGRIYLGNISNSYILDKEYNKVGHIKSMAKLDKKKNKVIITHNEKYYSLPIYSLDDLLKIAKEYLNK